MIFRKRKISIDGGVRTRGEEEAGRGRVDRDLTRSDLGEARKDQIMQGFASHAEEFGLYPEGSREPLKDGK